MTAPTKIDPAEVMMLELPADETAAECDLIGKLAEEARAGAPTPAAAVRCLVYAVTVLAEEDDAPEQVLSAAAGLLRLWRDMGQQVGDAVAELVDIEPPEGWQERVLAAIPADGDKP